MKIVLGREGQCHVNVSLWHNKCLMHCIRQRVLLQLQLLTNRKNQILDSSSCETELLNARKCFQTIASLIFRLSSSQLQSVFTITLSFELGLKGSHQYASRPLDLRNRISSPSPSPSFHLRLQEILNVHLACFLTLTFEHPGQALNHYHISSYP